MTKCHDFHKPDISKESNGAASWRFAGKRARLAIVKECRDNQGADGKRPKYREPMHKLLFEK
jgi:hypothetical protein